MVEDETARQMIRQHMDECSKRYDRMAAQMQTNHGEVRDITETNGAHINRIEALMWRIMWGGIAGLAAIIGILVELRKTL